MTEELIPTAKSDDPSGNDRQERFVFTPPIDIYEREDGLVLRADLPGVTGDSLELQVQDNKLTLFGRVKPSSEENAVALHREYQVGDFLRSFILSDEVDHDRISASLNNGVLEVVLPKFPKVEPRRIQVTTD
ncbi:MAG: Hsp20/alpha crystallin family protein [Planctomycetaceae bacterium]